MVPLKARRVPTGRRAALVAAVVGTCLLPGAVAGESIGTVSGRVTLTTARGGKVATSPYGRRAVAPRPASAGPETQQVVVYLAGSPAGAPQPMQARIVHRGERFIPPVVAVTVGSTVEFPNDDPFFHNVFSLSRAATFDLGPYPAGETRARRFTRPGIVKIFCDIHAHMSALVLVLEHAWFAIADERGEFTLPPVPAGDHTLVVWHERVGERREPIHVDPGGETRVSFTLPVLEPES